VNLEPIEQKSGVSTRQAKPHHSKSEVHIYKSANTVDYVINGKFLVITNAKSAAFFFLPKEIP
jgi:hypothetical protein